MNGEALVEKYTARYPFANPLLPLQNRRAIVAGFEHVLYIVVFCFDQDGAVFVFSMERELFHFVARR